MQNHQPGFSALLISGLAMLVAAQISSAQTSNTSQSPLAVIDRGPFWRTFAYSNQMTNAFTGTITGEMHQFTELSSGLHYLKDGQWVESQSSIELGPGGAQAVQGQHKAYFNPNLNSPGSILLTTPTQTIQTRPLGLYYFDPTSGKTALVAPVQDCVGELVPPNRVVYPHAFGELGDVMYVYAVNGFEQNVVLLKPPPPPDAYGLSSASRLEVWTAFNGPLPQEQRPILLQAQTDPAARQQWVEPDLIDHVLVFGDCWFPLGTAFVLDGPTLPAPDQPALITLASPSDSENLFVAKNLLQIDNQTVLVESVDYQDLAAKFKAFEQAALPADRSETNQELVEGRQLGPRSAPEQSEKEFELASAVYAPCAVVIDYTLLSGGASSFTFSNGWTYCISNSFSVGPGAATFQQNSTVKYATNAYLLIYGSVSFPSSGTPDTFTSVDDNAYGEVIANSTAVPNYAAKPALWMYYETSQTTVKNARVRWAQRGIEEDENSGVNVNPQINSTSFLNCNVGIYLNAPGDKLYLTGDTGCNLVTPITIISGDVSGNITTDCGVVSVARVNDSAQDTASGDPTGDPNKNSQSECSFVLVDTNRIVAAFFDTHLSEFELGEQAFPAIASPRSIGWAVSTNGGTSFTDNGPVPPTPPADVTQGDAGDPVMVRDTANGTIYLLGNPSRESASWLGFRLWKSTDNGQNFSLINTNVPGGFSKVDKPMIAVNNFTGLSTSTNLYVAGRGLAGSLGGVFVARSTNAGVNWTGTNFFATTNYDSIGADIAIRPDGTVYLFYLAFGYNVSNSSYTNWLQYNWLPLGQSNWHAGTIVAHADSTNLYSTNAVASGNLKRSNSADEHDFFEDNGFPRVAVNSSNGHIYLVFADRPSVGSTIDRGDIWINEGTPNADGSLNWALNGARKVNNDRTSTDQWNPSITVNPSGTEVFIGYYSRQTDPNNNALIKAYGAKADVANGLATATFDTFPVSNVAFTNLFCGTTNSTPSSSPWLFDWAWAQTNLCFDVNARVVDCNSTNAYIGPVYSPYQNFTADDYTWSNADSSYFYFAWRDCSDLCTNTWNGTNHVRPDPNIRMGKIKQ